VCCRVLQCVTVCCRMLRCVAACCSLLQCAAVCHLLQYIAVCCSSLQCDAVCCSEPCVADSQELAHGSCVSSRGEGGGKTQESTSQDSLVRSKKIHPRCHFPLAPLPPSLLLSALAFWTRSHSPHPQLPVLCVKREGGRREGLCAGECGVHNLLFTPYLL